MEDNGRIKRLIEYLESHGHPEEASYLIKLADQPTEDERYVAATLMGEARGEADVDRAMKAVYTTILNRKKVTGRTMKDIVLAKKQYSYWNMYTNDSNDSEKPALGIAKMESAEKSLWDKAIKIAKGGEMSRLDEVSTATHYFNPAKAKPSWASPIVLQDGSYKLDRTGENVIGAPCWEEIIIIGNHKFGTDYSWEGRRGREDKCQPSPCKCDTWPSERYSIMTRSGCRTEFSLGDYDDYCNTQ